MRGRGWPVGGWICALATCAGLLEACASPPTRDELPPPTCGDAIVNVSPPSNMVEDCDLGSANGTVGSTCTKQCLFVGPEIYSLSENQIDSTPTSIVSIESWLTGDGGFVYSELGSTRLAIDFVYHSATSRSPSISLERSATVLTVGAIGVPGGTLPVWVERDSSSTLHMFYASASVDYQSANIVEVSYPFADGFNPQFVADDNGVRFAAVLVDQSSNSAHDLLVAVMTIGTDGQLNASTDRFPLTTPAARGFATGITYERDGKFVEEVLQFFDNPGEFVSVGNVATDSSVTLDSTYSITEVATGTWPFRVVDAIEWDEAGPAPRCEQQHYDRPPLAVLTASGDTYVWPFPASADAETFLTPFASFQPGTSVLFNTGGHAGGGLFTIEPSGMQASALDSACNDLLSPSLGVNRAAGIAPWTTSVRVRGIASWCCGNAIFDNEMVWW
jgi:hypothetical protein